MARPASPGPYSRTCCSSRATSTKQAMRAAPPSRFTAMPPLTRASRSTPVGRTGSAARRSTRTNPITHATARIAAPTTSMERSPRCGADSTPKTTATAAPVRRVAPAASNGRLVVAFSAREQHPSGHADDGGDRTGDEEDALPGEGRGEDAAQRHTGGSADGGRGAPAAHGASPSGAGEPGQDHRHGGGAQHRRTRALDQPGADEDRVGRRKTAENRAEDEHTGAEEEHPASPEDVRGASRDEQQTAERQEVGVQHPGGSDRREPEVGRDGGERHVQDAGVEHHRELSRDQGEHERRCRAA